MRRGYNDKDLKWMEWCAAGAEIFSTCGKRNYMAIVVDARGIVVSTGYNGGPPGALHCIDGGCERFKENSTPGSSYDNCIAIHAEQNALMHADSFRANGGTLYVNGPPCFSCAKMTTNAGISRIVYTKDPNYNCDYWDGVETQLDQWGVTTTEIPWTY